MTHTLLTIGDALIDIFFILDEKNPCCTLDKKKKKLCFHYGDKMSIRESTHSIGGNAANVAVGAAKLGIKTAIASWLGDDLNGHVIHEALKDAGVDTRHVALEKEKETRYSIVLNYRGERTILSYHGKRTYRLPRVKQTSWIYYTSLGPGFERLQNQLLLHVKNNPEITLAMNPGSYQMTYGMNTIKKILPKVGVLFVNKEEAARLVGKGPIKTLFGKLHGIGIPRVFITDSEAGSYASDGAAIFTMPPYPIKAIAKTGAGDAYTSGALSAIMKGKGIAEAMQWGTANAGGVIQKFGAQEGLLTERSIELMIQKYKNITPKKY